MFLAESNPLVQNLLIWLITRAAFIFCYSKIKYNNHTHKQEICTHYKWKWSDNNKNKIKSINFLFYVHISSPKISESHESFLGIFFDKIRIFQFNPKLWFKIFNAHLSAATWQHQWNHFGIYIIGSH